jgi:hypothetical protein
MTCSSGLFGFFVLTEITLAWIGSHRILSSQAVRNIDTAFAPASNTVNFPLASNFEIDHIYYFNSFVRPVSNRFMKDWLSLQDITFSRIEAISGDNVDVCKQRMRCLNDRMVSATYAYLALHGGLRSEITRGDNSTQEHYLTAVDDGSTSSTFDRFRSGVGVGLSALNRLRSAFSMKPPLSSTFDLPFGDRPNHDSGKPYYNLSGTTLVVQQDNIRIPNLDHLRSAIAQGVEQGLISSQNWEVIRLECCDDDGPGASIDTTPLVASDIRVNSSWTMYKQTAGVLLWRDTALQTFSDRVFSRQHYNYATSTVEHRIAKDFYSYSLGRCLCRFQPETPKGSNNSATESYSSMILTPLRRLDDPMETKISLERLRQEVASKQNQHRRARSSRKRAPKIDRVYYSNLEKNKIRRQSMEHWMDSDPLLKASHKRINASIGDPLIDQCAPKKSNPGRCRGLAGVSKTLLGILDGEDTTGISLVLEDDFVITDPGLQRMEASLELVPEDWDLIRFDCVHTSQVHFQWINPFVANTSTLQIKFNCSASNLDSRDCRNWFCGGAYAMLWREESIHKLRAMWGRIPYDDVDCVIARTPSIRSYCVNVGIGDMFVIDSEVTDIPKLGV